MRWCGSKVIKNFGRVDLMEQMVVADILSGSSEMEKDLTMYVEKGEITCRDIKSLLYAYHERELPSSLHLRCEQHIAQCPCCQHEVASYALIPQLAAELPEVQVSDRMKANLRKVLSEKLGIALSVC